MLGFKDYMYLPWQPSNRSHLFFHYYTEMTQEKNSPTPPTSPLRRYTSPSSIVLCIRFQSLNSSVHTYVMTSFTPVVTPFIHNKCCGVW
jgi:hypothetical protein